MPTLDDLLKPRTEQQIFDSLRTNILDVAADDGVTLPTNWTSGATLNTILRAVARAMADKEDLQVTMIEAGFWELAEGDWLDLRAQDEGLTRNPASFAKHRIKLTAAAGFGPYVITTGQLWVATPSGLRFNSLAGGTLPLGGTLYLEVKAEQAGSLYNVADGQITILQTPLPGVTITNEVGSLLETGADAETDDALRLRGRLRYPTLSATERVREAYEQIALNAHPDVRRVLVRDDWPRGPNTVDIVIWGSGGISGAALTAVNDAIQLKKGTTADVLVYAATQVNQAVTATIRCLAGYGTQVNTRALARMQDLEDRYPIGGQDSVLYRSQVLDALFVPDSEITGRNGQPNVVRDVALTTPAGNVAMTALQVIKFTPITLTIVEV